MHSPHEPRPVPQSRGMRPFTVTPSVFPAQDLEHTLGHLNCPACERSRRQMLEPNFIAELGFVEAAAVWLDGHAQHISAGTLRDYNNCIAALTPFFGALSLRQIHIGHFEQYQKMRSLGSGGLRGAGPSRVNHELNTLSQILTRAGLWAPLAPNYKPLRLPRPKVGRSLSPEESHRLFSMAASNPRWKVAYCCALITVNTTAGPSEIRHLRLRDVDVSIPAIRIIEGIKNEYRQRTIPLNKPALWAVRSLLERAMEIGAHQPEHYLLPHRAANGRKGFDVERPITSWRGAWKQFTNAANLKELRFYDLRHDAITSLLADPDTSERTIMEIAGHVTRAMLERYSHQRMTTKAQAVDRLAAKSAQSVGRAQLILMKK